jgi:hypothetical protein
MKTIGEFQFPETSEEVSAWKPLVIWRPLARRVLAVATTRRDGKWRAYCDAVPGRNHDDETELVLYQGCPLPRDVARALFPGLSKLAYGE